jgi:hypothetical protein
MTFLNFSQLLKSVFRQKKKENTFLETKPNFPLTEKYFSLTNFPNDKQHRKVWKVISRKPHFKKQT